MRQNRKSVGSALMNAYAGSGGSVGLDEVGGKPRAALADPPFWTLILALGWAVGAARERTFGAALTLRIAAVGVARSSFSG
jgi:hypothetical protein